MCLDPGNTTFINSHSVVYLHVLKVYYIPIKHMYFAFNNMKIRYNISITQIFFKPVSSIILWYFLYHARLVFFSSTTK